MQDRFFGSIRKGMDVVDLDGDKIGTVDKIFQPAAVTSTASSTAEPAGRPVFKVETGILGLGTDYYIPASAVRDVSTDRIMTRFRLNAKMVVAGIPPRLTGGPTTPCPM